jgi:CheY-like chemotaxis protein
MGDQEARRPLRAAADKIPHEFKAIAEDAAILVLIVIAASSADVVAERFLGEHIPPVIQGLLTASLWVMCVIYAIAVLNTMKKLIMGRLVANQGRAPKPTDGSTRLGRALGIQPQVSAQGSTSTASLLSVLVVDDDRLASTAIKYVLAEDPRIGTIATAISPDAAMAKITSGPDIEAPDVILLDVNYTGQDKTGVDYLAELHQAAPKSKLVVMSVCREYVKAAVAADADGFIWKNESAVDFAEAVVGASKHSFVASKSVTRDLVGTT